MTENTAAPQPSTQTVHIVGQLLIQDISVSEVYSFVSHLENDKLWYPGVVGSELIQGDGGPQTTYKTTMNMGQGEMVVTATVLATQPMTSFQFTSNGFLANQTEYRFEEAGPFQTLFTIDSRVTGTTTEMITGYMQQTFQGLLKALGKAGEVKSVQAEYVAA